MKEELTTSRPTGDLADMVEDLGVSAVLGALVGIIDFLIDDREEIGWMTTRDLLQYALQGAREIEEAARAKAEVAGIKPETCYGCEQVKVFSGEFCNECLAAWKEEGREVTRYL